MKTTYIQFNFQVGIGASPDTAKNTRFERIMRSILPKIFPLANPDFEEKIAAVRSWLVEFDGDTGSPLREIGLNAENRAIVKMPYRDNYGYWTDNNLLLDDFKKTFRTSEITREFFEEYWIFFGQLTDFQIELSNYRIQTTGADGGHVYLVSEINHNGQNRKLVVYFFDKTDEHKIKSGGKINLTGRLFDEGVAQSLSLNARIIG